MATSNATATKWCTQGRSYCFLSYGPGTTDSGQAGRTENRCEHWLRDEYVPLFECRLKLRKLFLNRHSKSPLSWIAERTRSPSRGQETNHQATADPRLGCIASLSGFFIAGLGVNGSANRVSRRIGNWAPSASVSKTLPVVVVLCRHELQQTPEYRWHFHSCGSPYLSCHPR